MQWELVESSLKVSRACREFVRSLPKVSGVCRKFVGSSLKVLGACREFVGSSPKVIGSLPECIEGSPEVDRHSPGVRRRLPGRSPGVEKGFPKKISSGHRRASTKRTREVDVGHGRTTIHYVGSESSSGIRPRFGRYSGNSSGDLRKLAEGIEGLPGVRRKIAEGIKGLPGVRRKLIEGVRHKLTKIHREFAGGYREDRRELGSSFSLSNDDKSPANCRLHAVATSSSSPFQRSLPPAVVISSNFRCRSRFQPAFFTTALFLCLLPMKHLPSSSQPSPPLPSPTRLPWAPRRIDFLFSLTPATNLPGSPAPPPTSAGAAPPPLLPPLSPSSRSLHPPLASSAATTPAVYGSILG
ncbi:hypothetical protein GW17_00039403, partial [Ensete ventricosum]